MTKQINNDSAPDEYPSDEMNGIDPNEPTFADMATAIKSAPGGCVLAAFVVLGLLSVGLLVPAVLGISPYASYLVVPAAICWIVIVLLALLRRT